MCPENREANNIDKKTVQEFGQEWRHFNQSQVSSEELQSIFESYFQIFPKHVLNQKSVGLDLGCGSGRWAKFIAPSVAKLYCVDASDVALSVAKKNLEKHKNLEFILASVSQMPIVDASLDFAYSLGVLHHVPDTAAGIHACVKKLKQGAPFLAYLYFAFDNKPIWYRCLWKTSDYLRRIISKLPFKIKLFVSQMIAAIIYFPLAKLAHIFAFFNFNVSNFPLSAYRNRSFYTMRTDALDRFSTRLEMRFTQKQIKTMFEDAGLTNIKFSPNQPYWCVIGYKKDISSY